MTMGTDPKALDPDMIGAMMTHSDIKAQSCTAEDVANVVLFFASDEASHYRSDYRNRFRRNAVSGKR